VHRLRKVRHKNGGWLQGFILITSFTTWQRWFKWNSLAPEVRTVLSFAVASYGTNACRHAQAGLLEAHKAGDLQKSVWDHDSSLTAQMDVQKRSGDPEKVCGSAGFGLALASQIACTGL
jgi:hypothetical protein